MKNNFCLLIAPLLCLASLAAVAAQGSALADGDSAKEDGWRYVRDESTLVTTAIRELVIYPKAAPRPALKYRLIPDEFDQLDGNAALFYLKAMGFFEQTAVQERIRELQREARASAEKQELQFHEVPPYSYLTTAPKDLPREEVRNYLNLMKFQTYFLEEARRLRSFSLDRNIRQFESPVNYLLPEVQSMRELARVQSVRCRLAIADGRLDDAAGILGQQYALARHVGSDDFYVSALVGIAIESIASGDAQYLIEHPDAPNLYWALATLPKPLVAMHRAHAFEREFLFEQLKPLREVDATRRPAEYWRTFIDRLLPHLRDLVVSNFEPRFPSWATGDREANRAAVIALVAASYPGAKRYLIERGDIPRETIDAYPTAQVCFLALKLFYENARDEYFKNNYVSPAHGIGANRLIEAQVKEEARRLGWVATLAEELLPAIGAVRIAQARSQQRIAILQTIEAIRMYASEHDGRFPDKLSDLPVPAPDDPLADQPLTYELNGPAATLSGKSASGFGYRLVLKLPNAK